MKNIILYSLFLIGILTSCFKDEGNYDYTEIGEAVIKAIPGVTDKEDKLVCLENEEIELIPEVEFLAGTTAEDYEFIWFRYPKVPQGTSFHYEQADTLAMTQNLKYKIVNSPREYWLVYKVKNKETGALTEKRFEFIISSVNGWIVLDEDAMGNGDLQIIRDADIVSGGDGRVVKDYFSVNNDGKKMRDARFMGICGKDGKFCAFTDGGGYIMNASTYKEIPNVAYTDLFSANVVLDNISPEAEYYSSWSRVDVIINSQKVFRLRHSNMMESAFIEPGGGVSDYLLEPVITPISISGDNCAVLFDSKNNRFITVGRFGDLSIPMSVGGPFNTGEISSDYKYVSMSEGKDGETCLVMNKRTKDGSEEPYLFRANFTSSTPVALDAVNLSSLEGIKEAKHYSFGTRGNYMFYATDSDIRIWKYGNETATDFFNVPSGEEIMQMKLYVNSSDNTLTGKILFVATRKGNEGKVYKIVFNEMSGVLVGEPQVYEGFGIIKDMFLK